MKTNQCEICDEASGVIWLSATNAQGEILDRKAICLDCLKYKAKDLLEVGEPREEIWRTVCR